MELYTLKINVNKQRLSFGENKPEIFSGDQSIDFVEFTFEDAMWNFPDIWAIFSRQKGTSYQVALEDNKVMIPAEVMQKRGYVYIGLMATDGENVQTSSVLQYSIGQGSTNVDAITPSASIYEQFLADLDAYQTAVADLDDIESRITTAEGNVSMIEQAVTDLNEQLDDINLDISTINGQITTIQNNIGTAQGDIVSIQNGINALNGQVAGLDTAVGTLSNRVTALQSSVTSLEGRLTTVGNTLTDFEGRLTTAGTTLTNLEGSISDAENDIQTVQGDIETIQSDIEDIQTAIEQNNVVTDVTAEGISLVDNHIADLSFMCVTDTASGDVASFPDGSGVAMKKAEVSLEPIQDLHGYDKPWPGGGGVNKFPALTPQTLTNVGLTCVVDADGWITLNGTSTTSGNLMLESNASGLFVMGEGLYFHYLNNFVNNQIAFVLDFTDNTSFSPAFTVLNRISDGSQHAGKTVRNIRFYFQSGVTLTNAKLRPMLTSSSTAIDYSPYSNICPIDGYEDVGVSVVGKNYADIYGYSAVTINSPSGSRSIANNYGTTLDSVDYIEGTPLIVTQTNHSATQPFSFSNGYFAIGVKGLTNEKQYKFSAKINIIDNPLNITQLVIYPNGSSTSFTMYINNGVVSGNFTYQKYSERQFLEVRNGGMSYALSDIMITEVDADISNYEPYTRTDYTTDLGRTVYGGTVDLASGRLVIDKGYVDLGTLSWTKNWSTGDPTHIFYTTVISDAKASGQIISSGFEAVTGNPNAMANGQATMFTNSRLYACAAWTTDATVLKTSLNGVQLVYELATPQTYQLTPQQIQTLIGANNVWSDSGTIEVEYIANLKDYIDKKINA